MIAHVVLIVIMFVTLSSSSTMHIDAILAKIEKESGCKIIVTSGFRSKGRNSRVGGVPNSFHLYDRARDIKPKDKKCMSIKDLGKLACKYTTTITYSTHVQIDNRKVKLCFKGKRL